MCQAQSPFFLGVNNQLKPGNNEWYIRMAMGVNTMAKIMSTMCGNSGVVGKKTNHSVRRTMTNQLLNAGVPNSAVAHLTGHKNVGSLVHYHSPGLSEQQNMCNILCRTPKKVAPSAAGSERQLVATVDGAGPLASQSVTVDSKISNTPVSKTKAAAGGWFTGATISGNITINVINTPTKSTCTDAEEQALPPELALALPGMSRADILALLNIPK